MAWEWSHTAEAYEYAREQIENLPRETLVVVYAEWYTDFRKPKWEKEYSYQLSVARDRPNDILADVIWEKAEEQRTCDNGGFNAWICPFGCHTVPFGPDKESVESRLTRKEW